MQESMRLGDNCFYEDNLHMINFNMKCLEVTTYAKTPMRLCMQNSPLLVRWNETLEIPPNVGFL